MVLALALAGSAHAAELQVTDGDTVRLGNERIRLEGIDAPELFSPKCPAERRLAEAATEALRAQLAAGPVEIARHGQDRYGRTLARLYVGGHDVGEALVSAGLARVWTGRRLPWC